jgi:hypothetical protein
VAALFSAVESASRAKRELVLRGDAQAEADRLLEQVSGALRRASLATVAAPGPSESADSVRFCEVRAIAEDSEGGLEARLAERETAFWRTPAGELAAERGGEERTIARGVARFEVTRLGASRAFRILVEVERWSGARGAAGATRHVGTAVGEVLVAND